MDDPQEPIASLHLFKSIDQHTFCIGIKFSLIPLTLIVITPARHVAETDGVNTCKCILDCDLNIDKD